MIIGQDKLFNWIRSNRCMYWAIYDRDTTGETRRKIGDNYDMEQPTIADGISRLRDFLSNYNDMGGKFYILASINSNPKNLGYYTWYTEPAISQFVQNSINGIGAQPQQPAIDIQAEISKQVSEQMYKIEQERLMRELQAENKALKLEIEEYDSPLERIAKRAEPYIPHIANMLGMTTTTKAIETAVGNTDTDLSTDEEKTVKALDVLSERVPNLAEVLEKLSKLDDVTLNMALKFL